MPVVYLFTVTCMHVGRGASIEDYFELRPLLNGPLSAVRRRLRHRVGVVEGLVAVVQVALTVRRPSE